MTVGEDTRKSVDDRSVSCSSARSSWVASEEVVFDPVSA